MITWDDFQEQLNKINREIDRATEALEKMRVSFQSLANTYQEFIDYCNKGGYKNAMLVGTSQLGGMDNPPVLGR